MKDQLRKREPAVQANHPKAPETDRTATIERVPDPDGVELEKIWDQEWQTVLLEAVLEKVKRQVDLKQWQIFDLYVLKEWSPRDVAKALEVSAARVYLVKHRISALLKRERKRLEGRI
jgi:RNA polymerase sigma-70 factor (ECF subfamily)